MAEKKRLVMGTSRKPVARPQPPHKDIRTARERDRSSQNRNAINRSFRGE